MPHPRLIRFVRYGWAAPATLVGLVLAVPALVHGRLTVSGGVLEIHGPWLRRALGRLPLVPGGVAAITFGHVVLGCDAAMLDGTRAHERVHVAQYERWGPLFLIAYPLASLWALARGGDPYFDNRFEREARVADRGADRWTSRKPARC